MLTGCSSGIGLETLRVLALRGARVIGTATTAERAAAACAAVSGDTAAVALDLADFAGLRRAADEIARLASRLDIVVLNAGIFAPPRLETVAGVERTFAINHLGHFVLVSHLMPLLGTGTRLVVLSSRAAVSMAPAGGIEFDNLDGGRGYDMRRAYGHSKLANALFALEFARRHAAAGISCNAVHPGFVRSRIGRRLPLPVRALFTAAGYLAGRPPAIGAATPCFVAASPALDGVTGRFFADCREADYPAPHYLADDAMARRLWALSAELVAGCTD